MRVQRENLNILFGKIPPEIIAERIVKNHEHEVSYKSLPRDLFINLSSSLKSNYSKDERREQYNILLNDMKGNDITLSGKSSVFNAVYAFSESVLTTNRYVPICKYDCLLKWNDISHDLGQDLFTTCYLAFEDARTGSETNFFAWNPIIDTTNERLYRMLEEGLAENHYHLYGSSQCFPINWISIMNEPVKCLKNLDIMETHLNPRISYSQEFNITSWNCKLIWAAYIRCYLFEKINIIKDLSVINSQKEDTQEKNSDKPKSGNQYSNILFIQEKDIIDVLNTKSPKMIQNHLPKLTRNIHTLQYLHGMKSLRNNFCIDYALLKTLQQENFNYNRILVGERKFLYDCFCEYAKGILSDFDCNVLYLYLLIKLEFRHEFIQSNKELGFKNFSDYQSRKLLFVNSTEYFDEAIRLALNMPLETQNLVSFEARIMPQKSADKLKRNILSIDNVYTFSKKEVQTEKETKSSMLEDDRKYHYVIHYPKTKYEIESSNNRPLSRNNKCRQKNRKYTEALVDALKYDAYLRKAIRGIDACSNEIGCRPETFATDFRYLRQVIPNNSRCLYEKNEKPVQLKLTYHVGEDFLNLTDGLRAIDEAILFLNMRRCDRLGHALALGIDADKYYELKDYRVIMPKQDALDDDVWLLYKANELNIQIDKSLEQQMVYRIQDRIRYIYGDSLRKYNISADPFIYYNSWLLRGDNPELYMGYKYNDSKTKPFGYESFMVNKNIPSKTIREDADIVTLYGLYHYDEDVKRKGLETEILKISPSYVKLVKQIQKKMQFVLAEKGIAIECNPSSNYLIGTFRRYDAHPITIFNNTFLEHRQDKLLECAQLSVSVNTDDQGVFDTSLTNEYALLALALEKKRDSNGKRIYSASNIYQYLDSIRKMGIEQTFG